MKTLKKIFASTLLILAIGVPLYAGDVHFPANPTPTPATCSDCDEKTSGEIQTSPSDITLSAEPKTPETSEFAVDLLLALLSFF